MRRAAAIAMLTLAAILLEAIAAGTPVAGNETVAAVTAGINLGTAPVSRVSTVGVLDASISALRTLIDVLRLVVAGTAILFGAALTFEVPGGLRSLLRAQSRSRRGPPALA